MGEHSKKEKTIFRRHAGINIGTELSDNSSMGISAFHPTIKFGDPEPCDAQKKVKYTITVFGKPGSNKIWKMNKTYDELLELVMKLDEEGYDLPLCSFPPKRIGSIFLNCTLACFGGAPPQHELMDRQDKLEDFFLEMTTMEATWQSGTVQAFFCPPEAEFLSTLATENPTSHGDHEDEWKHQKQHSFELDSFVHEVLRMDDDHFTEDVSLSSFNYVSIDKSSPPLTGTRKLSKHSIRKPSWRPYKFETLSETSQDPKTHLYDAENVKIRRNSSANVSKDNVTVSLQKQTKTRPASKHLASRDCFEREERLKEDPLIPEEVIRRIEIHDKDCYTVTFRREPLGLHVVPDKYNQAPVVRGFLKGENDQIQQAEALQFIEPSDRIFAVSGQTTVMMEYDQVIDLITATLNGSRFESTEPSITFMRAVAFGETYRTYAGAVFADKEKVQKTKQLFEDAERC